MPNMIQVEREERSGDSDTGQRHTTWDLLHSIKGRVGEKWLVAGDFNEILQLSEKSGGCLQDINQMATFRQTLSDYNLEDMGATGGPYTWSNSSTKERLDHSVCTPEWLEAFGFSKVINLPPSRSDHVPLLIVIRREKRVHVQATRPYRFEEAWCSHETGGSISYNGI
ncbi:hypothetical protein ACLB2K_025972 [Fragaria x ananassa]